MAISDDEKQRWQDMSDEDRWTWQECQAFDAGIRTALRDQLRVLAAQATRQAERSGKTVQRYGLELDLRKHGKDWALANALTALVK